MTAYFETLPRLLAYETLRDAASALPQPGSTGDSLVWACRVTGALRCNRIGVVESQILWLGRTTLRAHLITTLRDVTRSARLKHKIPWSSRVKPNILAPGGQGVAGSNPVSLTCSVRALTTGNAGQGPNASIRPRTACITASPTLCQSERTAEGGAGRGEHRCPQHEAGLSLTGLTTAAALTTPPLGATGASGSTHGAKPCRSRPPSTAPSSPRRPGARASTPANARAAQATIQPRIAAYVAKHGTTYPSAAISTPRRASSSFRPTPGLRRGSPDGPAARPAPPPGAHVRTTHAAVSDHYNRCDDTPPFCAAAAASGRAAVAPVPRVTPSPTAAKA